MEILFVKITALTLFATEKTDKTHIRAHTHTHTLTLTLARALVERRFVSGVNVHVDNVFLSDNAKCIH